MTYETIHFTMTERVATITLNRPDRLNAWTSRMSAEVRNAMFQAAEDEMVRVIVLTGAGQAFCAGADMEELQTAVKQGPSALDRTGQEAQIVRKDDIDVREDFMKRYSYFPAIPKPIIAAINGPAVGIGLVLTLFCDMRMASDKARFSTVFAKRGLIAEHGISWILPRIIGLSKALDLLFTARMVSAEEALNMGLVGKVIPDERLMEEVMAIAKELSATVSPRSTRVMKQQVYNAQFQTLAQAIDIADEEMRLSIESEDFKEGVAHFLEKRPPMFTGK